MPNYKLTYFNAAGRAEVSRMIFALAGVKYEDIRIEDGGWPELKKKMPFGKIPILEVDGVVLSQSKAIARYLAKKYGLSGKSDIEQAKVDMIVDFMEDITAPVIRLYYEKDAAKKGEIREQYENEQLPTLLAYLEKFLLTNNGGDGYLVGDDLTVADLSYICLIAWPELFKVTIEWKKFPKLKALRSRVEGLPKIADWIAKRPKTEF